MDAPFAALIAFGRAAAEAGLLASTCGNASLRTEDGRVVITASGAALGALSPADLVTIGLDGRHLGGGRASMETPLHLRAYAARPAARAVLHAQSRAATLLCCAVDPPRNLDFIPEVPAYVRAHAYAPYAAPGSEALAASVATALADPEVTVVQMVNHGQVVVGASWEQVVRRATFFELAAWMAVQGLPLRTIPAADAAALRGYARDG